MSARSSSTVRSSWRASRAGFCAVNPWSSHDHDPTVGNPGLTTSGGLGTTCDFRSLGLARGCANLVSHLSQQIVDRVREHGRQIGQKPGHAVAHVDHPYLAGAPGARLEFGDHRGVDPRGDDASYRSQSVGSLEPGSFSTMRSYSARRVGSPNPRRRR